MNPFLRKLGIELPIIQAPMAGVSTPEMAAAVSSTGALGSIGVGSVDAETTRQMIAAVRARTDRPFQVNVFCHRPASADAVREAVWLARLEPEFARFGAKPPARLTEIYQTFLTDDAKLAVLLAERPAIVSFHFGLPSRDRIDALHAAGIVLLATATNLAEGQAIAAAGIDTVVAQGYEAGGHRGVFDPTVPDDRLGTMALTRLLVRRLDIPVIAAGGIMDGAGIAASLTLGAVAAQLGTAFIACPESSADAGYRAALLGPPAEHTTMTSAISGRSARCLANRFTALGVGVEPRAIPDYPIAYDAGKALHAAAKAAGEFGYGAQWAGQGAPLARLARSRIGHPPAERDGRGVVRSTQQPRESNVNKILHASVDPTRCTSGSNRTFGFSMTRIHSEISQRYNGGERVVLGARVQSEGNIRVVWRRIFSIAATVVVLLPTWTLSDDSDIPPSRKWVTVKNVSAEYTYIRGQRCQCGGGYEVEQQCTGKSMERHYDRVHCKCHGCGEPLVFFFDVTGIFAEYELAHSDEAKVNAFADLDRRFPKLSSESLPELHGLLKEDNPHVRAWGIDKIAKLKTPAACECLLDNYLQAGLLRRVEFDQALHAMGADLLPLIERRLRNPENAASFAIMRLLEEIKLPQSARLAERELRREMKKEDGWRRICYITLGELGFKESETLLLEAFESEKASPDDSLIWALGRCGTKKSLPIVRKAFESADPDVRLAAIVALGYLGDQTAIPDLMKLAEEGDGGDLKNKHNLVHNAIYALGHLRAKQAIPLLIQNLRAKPNCEYHYSSVGIYDDDDADYWTYAGDYIDVSIHALQRMGVRKALPEFLRILGDDKYYLNFDEVAEAAAELDLSEAVSAIIARLAKDYEYNVELFGKDRERYSPSLRKLTGRPFGENPKPWQEWLAQQPPSAGTPEK